MNFNQIYEKVYRESGEELEQERQEIKSKIVISIFITIIAAVLLFFITLNIVPPSYRNNLFLMCILFTFVILLLIVRFFFSRSGRYKRYNLYFKNNVIKSFIEAYNKDFKYYPNSGIGMQIYWRAGFERKYDRYSSEDLIEGRFKDGSKVTMAEVHTEEESRNKEGNVTYTTIFHGLFAKVEMQKITQTNIKIRKDQLFSKFGKDQRVEMDSSEFEKIFNVYSNNPINTMQLLTSDIMQMLVDFKNKYKVTPEITINRQNLFVRFATGDLFEANIMKKALDFDTLKRYYDMINFTLELEEKLLKNIKETDI